MQQAPAAAAEQNTRNRSRCALRNSALHVLVLSYALLMKVTPIYST